VPRLFAPAAALGGALRAGVVAASVTGRVWFERRIADEVDEMFAGAIFWST
jgi:hypothetical protein